jgi:hypothetical protein
MHREQFADVVAIEGHEIGDLLALGLGESQSLTDIDFETDVPGRCDGHRHAGLQNGTCATHAESGLV